MDIDLIILIPVVSRDQFPKADGYSVNIIRDGPFPNVCRVMVHVTDH